MECGEGSCRRRVGEERRGEGRKEGKKCFKQVILNLKLLYPLEFLKLFRQQGILYNHFIALTFSKMYPIKL